MRRVVVTGLGIVCSIGNNASEVCDSLIQGKSGICTAEDYQKLGFRCHVHGAPQIDIAAHVDRRVRRFMGDGAAWNYIAMQEAITDAGLEKDNVSNPRTGLIVGSGGSSTEVIVRAADTTREKGGPRKIGPFAVPACMSSTNAATLSVPFGIKGISYSISSACATSVHCIGHGVDLIRSNQQDIVFAGGGESLDWTLSNLFDAMGALSSGFNDNPQQASRPYDANRDGFVIAGGGGVVVLEDYEHAKARGAKIYAEVLGYAANSDGYDMVQPSGEGAVRCMQEALKNVHDNVDYINPHATSTVIGDLKEAEAMREVFGDKMPQISATKSMTGHSLGAAGVHETIYCLLMMEKGFIAPSLNLNNRDEAFADLPIVTETKHQAVNIAMTNSFGFGGTNGCLVLGRNL